MVDAGCIAGAFTSTGLTLASIVALSGPVMASLHALQACLLWNMAQEEVKASPSEALVASQSDQVFGQFLTEDSQTISDRLAAELTLLKAQ